MEKYEAIVNKKDDTKLIPIPAGDCFSGGLGEDQRRREFNYFEHLSTPIINFFKGLYIINELYVNLN